MHVEDVSIPEGTSPLIAANVRFVYAELASQTHPFHEEHGGVREITGGFSTAFNLLEFNVLFDDGERAMPFFLEFDWAGRSKMPGDGNTWFGPHVKAEVAA